MPSLVDKIKQLIVLGLAIINVACINTTTPDCPTFKGPEHQSPSAGCIVIKDRQLLVVENHSGKLSIPGGGTEAGESAQCSAHRETYEETGLDVIPKELIHVFDNGFHIYHCQLHAESGEITIIRPIEISRAFWLSPQEFNQHTWRFPGQEKMIARWMLENQ